MKKYKYIVVVFAFLLIGVWFGHFLPFSTPDYQKTTEIFLKSSGWEPIESDWKDKINCMTLDNFSGAWIAAKDSLYTIPGFSDPLKDAYVEIAGNWTSEQTGDVTFYQLSVRDTTGILSENENTAIQCMIAYYQDQIAMARIYLDINTESVTKEFYQSSFVNGWPVTVDRTQIKAAIHELEQYSVSLNQSHA